MSSNIRINKICLQCGTEFEAKKTTTRTCSDNCAKKYYKARQRSEKIEASNRETLHTRLKPIEDLKAKEFLTVRDVAALLNSSLRTVYRLIDQGNIKAANLSQRKTLIKRSDIDKLFQDPGALNQDNIPKTDNLELNELIPGRSFDIENSYTLTEIQNVFRISEEDLNILISRHSIPKIEKGWDTYLPKNLIDKLLSQIINIPGL